MMSFWSILVQGINIKYMSVILSLKSFDEHSLILYVIYWNHIVLHAHDDVT